MKSSTAMAPQGPLALRAPGRESFSREYYSKDTIKPQKPQQHSPKPLGNYHSSVVINQRTREGEAGTYGRQLHSQASSGDSHEQLLVKGRCSGLWEVSKGYLKYGNERERKKKSCLHTVWSTESWSSTYGQGLCREQKVLKR